MPLNAMNDGCDGEIEMKTSSLLARTTARKIVKSMFPVVFLRKVKLIFGLAIYERILTIQVWILLLKEKQY